MRVRYLVLVFALLGADAPKQGGAISGKVVAVKDGKPVSRDDIYVYLAPIPNPKSTKLPGEGLAAQIVQRNVGGVREFFPKVLVVPVGTTVQFPNLERQDHNVFSRTDPIFDLGRYNYDKKGRSQKFDLADEFDIFCDIHPTMWAKVKAVESPYIAKVTGGAFTFSNIPAGKYKVVAWVRNSPEVRSGVITLAAGGSVTLQNDLHLQVKSRSGCHDRKDGVPYDPKYGKPCPADY